MKNEIIKYLKEGKTYSEIAKLVDRSKATISYHAKQSGLSQPQVYKEHDWTKIQGQLDNGVSQRECIRTFGVNKGTWANAIKNKKIITYDKKQSIDDFLVENKKVNNVQLKKLLLKEGLLEYKCYNCGLVDWNDKPICLQLEHKNGRKLDNRIENLELLCPNCHSQTETFGSKNWKYQKELLRGGQTGKVACL